MTLRLLKKLRITAPKDHRPTETLNVTFVSGIHPARPSQTGRIANWIGQSILSASIVFACSAAVAQYPQQAPPRPDINAQVVPSQPQSMPTSSGQWQRQAMQMMQPPTQFNAAPNAQVLPASTAFSQRPMYPLPSQTVQTQKSFSAESIPTKVPHASASYVPPVHVPPNARKSQAGVFIQPQMQPYHPEETKHQTPARQASYAAQLQTPRTEYLEAVRNREKFERAAEYYGAKQEPVPVMAPSQYQSASIPNSDVIEDGFVRRKGALSQFQQTQLSDESLIRRGPGLQDRIANILSSSRNQNISTAKTPRQKPEVQQPTPIPPVNRIAETRAPSRQKYDAQHAYREMIKHERPAPRQVRSAMQDNHRTRAVAQVAAAEPVLSEPVLSEPAASEPFVYREPVYSEPIQDPFGDHPPLRPSHQSLRVDVARQDRTEKPISVLSRPVRHRPDNSNQTYLPSNRSVNEYREPGHEAVYQDEGDSTGTIQTDPGIVEDAFQELDDGFQDALNDNLGDLEELPNGQQEDSLLDELEKLDEDVEGAGQAPEKRSCDEFRSRLLDNPITNIALDISPPRSNLNTDPMLISRSWTDRGGNIVATGTMIELSRGYVVLDTGQKVSRARLSDGDLAAIAEFWHIPDECSVGNEAFHGRNWIPQTVTWKASALCHKPLYFENIPLERYGHSYGPFLQPAHSFAHFFVSLAALPYNASINPANECRYALGFYRPGNCAPWLKDPIPISLEGAKNQALISTGLAFIP